MARRSAVLQDNFNELSRISASTAYEVKRRRRGRGKRLVTGLLVVLFTLVAAAAVALAATYYMLEDRLGGGGAVKNELSTVLTEPVTATDPFYILLLGTDGREGEEAFRSDTILLARVDPEKKHVALVSIPRDTKVTIEGHGTQKINAAYAYGGRAGAVQAVSEFAGVPITHYVEVNFDGFQEIVDALGGVEVDVPEEIDDPKAGPDIIEPGLQTLNGSQALTFCRSRNFPDGDYSRMRHQRIFLSALADQLLNKSDLPTMVMGIESASRIMLTDLGVSDIITLMTQFRGLDPETDIETVVVPSTPDMIGGVSYLVTDQTEWKKIMQSVDAGEPIVATDPANREDALMQQSAENHKITVDVINASGVNGAAGRASIKVENQGYVAGETSTATKSESVSTVYYKADDEKEAADKIAKLLSITDVKKDTGAYSYEGNILVVIGTDQ